MAKDKGSSGSGGNKPSGGSGGSGGNSGSKPSGGGSSPSGGGSSPSGGGSSGSGSRPSGGGSSPSGGGSNTPAKAVTAATIYQAAQSSKPTATPTTQTKAMQSSRPTATPTRPSTQSSGGSSPSNQQNRVQQLTQKAKTLIGGATSEGLADPNKFKDVLGKLKDLGKDTRVQNLQTQKKEAVTAAKTAAKPPITTFSGYTQEQMDEAIAKAREGSLTQDDLNAALANQAETGLTQDDLDAALSRYQSQNTASQSAASDAGAAASSTNEYHDWLNSFATEQDKGAFDPDLFNSLLGELESSKYRQKQWNERSARSAYGF